MRLGLVKSTSWNRQAFLVKVVEATAAVVTLRNCCRTGRNSRSWRCKGRCPEDYGTQ